MNFTILILVITIIIYIIIRFIIFDRKLDLEEDYVYEYLL